MYEHHQGKSTEAAPSASLISDSAEVTKMLHDVLARISKVGDQLHGPEPRDAGVEKGAPEPIPTVRRNIDKAMQVLHRISDELSRVESRI